MPSGRSCVIDSYIRARFRTSGFCNAVRRVRIFHAAGLNRIQFGNGTIILPTVMRKAVVPKNIVFHERNTLSFYGICNHRRRFVRRIMRISECGLKCIMIMSVELDNIPPKRAPLCSEILKFQCFFASIKALHVIMINDCGQVLESVMVGKQCSLPYGAFIAFPVSQYCKNSVKLAILFCSQCHTRRNGQPMPK